MAPQSRLTWLALQQQPRPVAPPPRRLDDPRCSGYRLAGNDRVEEHEVECWHPAEDGERFCRECLDERAAEVGQWAVRP